MAHMSRREYRMKKEHHRAREHNKKAAYSRQNEHVKSKFEFTNNKTNRKTFKQVSRHDYTHLQLNFWKIFSDRPYVAVTIIVIAIFLIMTKMWWGLAILVVLIALGIFIIGHSHHPNRVLSLEFRMKASRKLSMLRALQLGGSLLMFLATYMRQVVSVNFASAGSADSLQMVEGLLSNRGGTYGQQGSYFINLLNTITGGQLWSSYRYATNSAQMMNSASGRWIIMWIFVLMLAPAFCVLAQFFKEPYARNATLIAAIIASFSFILTPFLMRRWIVSYAVENQMNQQLASNAITIGPMAYVAMGCALGVLIIAFYRFVKKDNFS